MLGITKHFFVFGLLLASLAWTQSTLAAETDSDGDGLSDTLETQLHTNPTLADTDGDGFNDGTEVENGYSPRHAERIKLGALDSDNDWLPDAWEIRLGSDLLSPDTDGDGFNDGVEVRNGYAPTTAQATQIEKQIAVSLAQQHLTYSINGIALEDFPISSGVTSMPTPRGEFSVLDKVPVKRYGGPGFSFDYPNTKWNIHFTTGYWRYYIHGAYWHNNFGTPMSHGCVNVAYANMERLFDFTDKRTKIIIS